MSHEALKFNVIVNDTENWQPIVGSQDFGTFYMIYIRFTKNVEEVIDSGKTTYFYHAEFKIQNYEGEISMGFEGIPRLVELDEQDIKTRENLVKELIEDFNILSTDEQDRLLKMHHVDFILEFDVKPFDTDFQLPSNRLKGISKKLENHVLESTIERKIPSSRLYNPKAPLKSKYINPYHYKRAGDEILEIGFRNRNSNKSFNYIGHSGTLLSNCNPSRSFLI